MRSAVDLGLYCGHSDSISLNDSKQYRSFISGDIHKDWFQDLRRRLWWCVYSLDRLVAPYLGMSFFIPDEVITAKFPSLLDDKLVTLFRVMWPLRSTRGVKHGTRHWLKLRNPQSEMHTVFQYQHAQAIRDEASDSSNCKIPSFLRQHTSFSSWRVDMFRRLDEWRSLITGHNDHGIRPSTASLLELEYWQSIVMLYRLSIEFPAELVRLSARADNIFGPFFIKACENSDLIFFKIPDATNALQLYRVLQKAGLVKVVTLTAQDIFIAGKYWCSPRAL